MESKAVARRVKTKTKQDVGEVESKQATSAKAPASGDHGSVGIEVKQDMSATVADIKANLFLDQLQVDVTGTVVVMIYRMWDVNEVTNHYLSTDFVVSDAKLVDFNGIEPTDSKYLIDVSGYITNVGRTNHQKTGSRNLDFYLANYRGQSIRVTLWGSLGDVLIKKKAKQAGILKALITNMPTSGKDSKKLSVPVDHSAPREGTLENLLMWVHNRKNDTAIFHCKVRIANVRTRKGWNFPSYGSENCTKGSTRKLRQFWCESCNKCVEFPVLRLELDITDDTANAVEAMFDEPAITLVGCSAESVMEDDDEGVVETVSSRTLDAKAATESPKLKILTRDPSVHTPSKPSEERQTQRVDIKDSDSEEKGDTAMHVDDKKKGLRVEPGRKIVRNTKVSVTSIDNCS
ncbi:nucleic acid-binding, OB-fold protein [Tanacetum coccineum]